MLSLKGHSRPRAFHLLFLREQDKTLDTELNQSSVNATDRNGSWVEAKRSAELLANAADWDWSSYWLEHKASFHIDNWFMRLLAGIRHP